MRYVACVTVFFISLALHAQSGGSALFSFPTPPDVKADSTILFRLKAPYAKQVSLAFDNKIMPMQKDAKGLWSVTSKPMKPDIYAYNFIVNSFSVIDPSNTQAKFGYYGNGQSIVAVPGNPPNSWDVQNVPHGIVSRHIFRSSVVGDDRDFYVYTPPGYDANRKEPYPVLYLLHGIGDDARAWTQLGVANIIFDNLIAQGQIKPMIAAFTLGYGVPKTMVGDGAFENFTKSLLDEVMPEVEKKYNATTQSNMRAIAGLSMGGAEAVYAGLNNTDKFQWIGGFSSAFVMYRGAGRAGTPVADKQSADAAIYDYNFPGVDQKVNDQVKLLWISCGTSDFLMFSNKDFENWLTKKNINFTNVETPGAHTWMVWRRNLEAFVQLIFK